MSSSHDHTEPSVDYDLAAAVWRRRKWLAVCVAALTLAGATSLALSLPDVYRASATVLVERQQVSEAFVRPSVTAELETRIQTIRQQIMSRARLSEVINRLNVYPELRGVVPINALVERMRREVSLNLSSVEQMTGRTTTIAFSVGYTGREPATVAAVVNTLVNAYIEENTKSREQQAARTADFLKTQLDTVRQELDEHERRTGQFKQRYTAELPQQVEANLSALARLNDRLRLNGEYQIRALERRERLEHEQTLAASKPAAADADSPAVRLETLRRQLKELRAKYSDRYPDVIRVTEQISALERQPAPVGTNGHDADGRVTTQTLNEVERDLESLRREEQTLRQIIAGVEARVDNAPKRSEELEQLSRDYTSTKDRYDILLKRYEEARLAETLEQGQSHEQFRMLDPALPPTHPSGPNRMWLLAMGLVAAVGLAFLAIVLAERLDTTFHTADDLRSFSSLAVVAAIRRIPTRAQARGRRLRFALVAISMLLAVAVIAAGARYVGSDNDYLVRLAARGSQ
jgi:succinoglycan biosynthesis transport protein ExoP